MKFKKLYIASLFVAVAVFSLTLLNGCKVTYSLSGASISPLAKTYSVAHFPNNAPMVAPILSTTLTDALKDRFTRQTRLSNVFEGGDLAFEGEIIGYTSTPSAISGAGAGDVGAVRNKLTITVRVRFNNVIEPEYSFTEGKVFSQSEDYDSNIMLQEAESTLIPEIVEKLVEDIFNAAVSNW